VIDVLLNQPFGVLLRQRCGGPDAFALRRSIPALQFSVRLRVRDGTCHRPAKTSGSNTQVETECRLGELSTDAGRCFSIPSVTLQTPSAGLKQRWETGNFYFALTAGKGSKRGINKS
jgi:hypothetical protein